jgi:hypothetical protein
LCSFLKIYVTGKRKRFLFRGMKSRRSICSAV